MHLSDPHTIVNYAESAEEDNRNYRESVTNLNESESDRGEDQATHSSNVSDVSEVSDSLSQETTGLEPPTLARTSQYLKNLQEAERVRKSKSKVAQAAEANTSGRGVIDDGVVSRGHYSMKCLTGRIISLNVNSIRCKIHAAKLTQEQFDNQVIDGVYDPVTESILLFDNTSLLNLK